MLLNSLEMHAGPQLDYSEILQYSERSTRGLDNSHYDFAFFYQLGEGNQQPRTKIPKFCVTVLVPQPLAPNCIFFLSSRGWQNQDGYTVSFRLIAMVPIERTKVMYYLFDLK